MTTDNAANNLAVKNLTLYFNNLNWFWKLFFPKELANALLYKLSNQKISGLLNNTSLIHKIIFPRLTVIQKKTVKTESLQPNLQQALSNKTQRHALNSLPDVECDKGATDNKKLESTFNTSKTTMPLSLNILIKLKIDELKLPEIDVPALKQAILRLHNNKVINVTHDLPLSDTTKLIVNGLVASKACLLLAKIYTILYQFDLLNFTLITKLSTFTKHQLASLSSAIKVLTKAEIIAFKTEIKQNTSWMLISSMFWTEPKNNNDKQIIATLFNSSECVALAKIYIKLDEVDSLNHENILKLNAPPFVSLTNISELFRIIKKSGIHSTPEKRKEDFIKIIDLKSTQEVEAYIQSNKKIDPVTLNQMSQLLNSRLGLSLMFCGVH